MTFIDMLITYIYDSLPTRQGSFIARCIPTWRWEDDLLWANIKVFRTSFDVPASEQRNSYVRILPDVGTSSSLGLRRMMTSGKLSYRPKVGCPLNVRGRRLAEWVIAHTCKHMQIRMVSYISDIFWCCYNM